jgi:hypothetical protein
MMGSHILPRPTRILRRVILPAALPAIVAVAIFLPIGGSSAATTNTLHVATTGSDEAKCTATAPCLSFQRAFAVASAGAAIEVAGGTYPAQTITRVDRPAGNPITIRPGAGQTVVVDELLIGYPESGNGPRDLIVDGITVGPRPVGVYESSERVTLRNLRAPNFYVRGAQFVRVEGGVYGPCITDGVTTPCANSKIDGTDPRFALASDITIDRVRFQDYRIVPGSGAHFECLFIRAGVRISVLRSTFERCEFFDIFIQYSGQPITDLRLEGNRFNAPFDGGPAERDSAIELSGRGYVFDRISIVRNSFVNSFPFLDDGTNGGLSNVLVEGNIAKMIACHAGVAYRRNFTNKGRPCDPTDAQATYGYTVGSGALLPDPQASAAVREAYGAVAKGMTEKQIVKLLRSKRRPAPPGGWNVKTLDQLLRDKFFLGSTVGAAGSHPAVVPYKTWRQAQRALARSNAR